MKVKNIAFSGFAAAILAGVGAAQAADAKYIVSPAYVTNAIAGKQDKLTQEKNAGTGIAISEAGVISADMSTATVGETGQTVEALLDEKQNKLENATVLETITADDLSAIDTNTTNITNLTNTVNNLSTTVGGKADADDVYTKTETDDLLAGKQNSFTLKENGGLVWENGQLTTSGIVTDATLTGVQTDVADLKTLVGDTAVATQIANAVKTETDARVAADDAIDGRLDTLETASATHALKSDIENMATTTYVDQKVGEIEEYDDAEVRGLIATNATSIATNAEDIATNTRDITALQNAGYIPAPDGNGLWLANVTDDGVAWQQVEILDSVQ